MAPMNDIQICARTEGLADQVQDARWPVDRLTWYIDPTGAQGVFANPTAVVDAFTNAWAMWSKGIQLDATRANDPNQANVQTKFGPIDGNHGILAWSELADGTMTVKHQLFDSGDRFDRHTSPVTQGLIDLDRVACHEIGHVLGLVHDAQGTAALMAPIYSEMIPGPTQRDYDRLVGLGYQRRTGPVVPVPPVTPPSNAKTIILAFLDYLTKQYAGKPYILMVIGLVRSLVDNWLARTPQNLNVGPGTPATVKFLIHGLFDFVRQYYATHPLVSAVLNAIEPFIDTLIDRFMSVYKV